MHHPRACAAPARARILEEGDVGARAPLLVGVEEVVDGRVVLVDRLLDEPETQSPRIELDIPRRVAGDPGDVVDSFELHRRRLPTFPRSRLFPPERPSSTLPSARRMSVTRTSIGSPSRNFRPPAAADERDRERVELEVVAGRLPGGQEALEDLAEAREQAAEPISPMISPSKTCSQPSSNRRASSSQARQSSSARYSIPAASRSRTEQCSASSASSSGSGSSAAPQLVQQRAVHDEIRVAPDRRGEVAVRAAREAGVAEVARVVAGLLERAQDERAERLLPALRARGELGHELAGRGCDLRRLARSHRLRVGLGGVGTSSSARRESSSSTDWGSGGSWTR